jgi:hypothetical protein
MTADPDGPRLLAELREEIRRSSVRPSRVEVGVAVSVALGRERGSVSCGGCQVPLEVDGIPAETVLHLKAPYHLVRDAPPPA